MCSMRDGILPPDFKILQQIASQPAQSSSRDDDCQRGIAPSRKSPPQGDLENGNRGRDGEALRPLVKVRARVGFK